MELVAVTADDSIAFNPFGHSIILADRTVGHIELNFSVSVSNSRRADAFRGCESSLLRTEFSELHRARYCCEGILLFEAALERM